MKNYQERPCELCCLDRLSFNQQEQCYKLITFATVPTHSCVKLMAPLILHKMRSQCALPEFLNENFYNEICEEIILISNPKDERQSVRMCIESTCALILNKAGTNQVQAIVEHSATKAEEINDEDGQL